MPPKLIEEGKIQVLGDTFNSVVYAVETESATGHAKDTPTVLKGATFWYKGEKPFVYNLLVTEEKAIGMLRRDARMYEFLGPHPRLVVCHGLEMCEGRPWALRLQRVRPGRNIRHYIVDTSDSPAGMSTRIELAAQFTEGLAYLHSRNIIWSDLSTRNALVGRSEEGTLDVRLCDFVDSELEPDYPGDTYEVELRYCIPGFRYYEENKHGKFERELFSLGTAICEITEWAVPYGPYTEMMEIHSRVQGGEWPHVSEGNPAAGIIRKCWEFNYDSAKEVEADLRKLLGQLVDVVYA